jgi:sugar O-acyltransferase (sialic acid O-acetyltransferase NeuD family)
MTTPWVVLGGGGHAGVVIDTLLVLGETVIGYTDPASERGPILDIPCMGGDEMVDAYDRQEVHLANGLGSTARTDRRAELYHRFASRGYQFPTIVHPSAVVARSVQFGAGAQVLAGAVVQPNCRVGENVLINTRASVDHDCVIEADVHIAPGVTVSGGVVIEKGAHVGTGASIVEGKRIGAQSIVGAGALVLRDVMPGTTVVGLPAKVRG